MIIMTQPTTHLCDDPKRRLQSIIVPMALQRAMNRLSIRKTMRNVLNSSLLNIIRSKKVQPPSLSGTFGGWAHYAGWLRLFFQPGQKSDRSPKLSNSRKPKNCRKRAELKAKKINIRGNPYNESASPIANIPGVIFDNWPLKQETRNVVWEHLVKEGFIVHNSMMKAIIGPMDIKHIEYSVEKYFMRMRRVGQLRYRSWPL